MRKVIIATAVALVLFTVGAFAANFGVESEDVTSGSDTVDACATSADIDFTTSYETASNDWRVTGVTVFFEGGTQCVGFNATVVIHATGTTPTYTINSTAVVAGGQTPTGSMTISGTGPLVGAVTRASLLVDGEQFTGTVTHRAHN